MSDSALTNIVEITRHYENASVIARPSPKASVLDSQQCKVANGEWARSMDEWELNLVTSLGSYSTESWTSHITLIYETIEDIGKASTYVLPCDGITRVSFESPPSAQTVRTVTVERSARGNFLIPNFNFTIKDGLVKERKLKFPPRCDVYNNQTNIGMCGEGVSQIHPRGPLFKALDLDLVEEVEENPAKKIMKNVKEQSQLTTKGKRRRQLLKRKMGNP
jgi:hypothetical protein